MPTIRSRVIYLASYLAALSLVERLSLSRQLKM